MVIFKIVVQITIKLVKMGVEAKQQQYQTEGRASQAAARSANLCGTRMSPE
jgi:hypothetical protein